MLSPACLGMMGNKPIDRKMLQILALYRLFRTRTLSSCNPGIGQSGCYELSSCYASADEYELFFLIIFLNKKHYESTLIIESILNFAI